MNLSHGLKYASLRYFNVAGAIDGWRGARTGVPSDPVDSRCCAEAAGEHQDLGRDYPTAAPRSDYVHVRDPQRRILALGALSEAKSRLIYNIGNGQGFSVLEVIESVRRVTGKPIAVEECPRRPGDPAVLVASSEKIKTELGWKPKFAELDQIIASAWEWHHQKRYAAEVK
jgi:UDP-glucose 4-epimerase